MMLFLRNLLWVVLCPGIVTVLIPIFFISKGEIPAFFHWTLFEWLGAIVLTSGCSLLVLCVFHFAKTGRGTLSPVDPVKKLVRTGPYKYVRNPMYLAVMLILAGEVIFFQSPGLIIYSIAVFSTFNLFILLHEEPWLRRHFGKEYEDYCREVNRWIPRAGKS